ncbi:MAG: hypothetical protein IRY86_03645 [Thermorudis peleae]|nr:hypothetical protein [Thermorudis peleae]
MVHETPVMRTGGTAEQRGGWLARVSRLFRTRPTIQPDRVLIAMLTEAIALPGCPVCRLLAERELRGLESILWEQVTDPDTHRALLAARGFCFIHSWALVPAGDHVFSHHGVAILLQRILVDLLQTVKIGGVAAARRWLTPRTPCPACIWEAQRESTLLTALAWIAMHEPELVVSEPALLCQPHAHLLAITLERIAPAQAARWRSLLDILATRYAHHHRSLDSAQQLALRVGRRPPYLPPRAEYCPWCQAEREYLSKGTAWLCDRARAWTTYLDAPQLVAQLLLEENQAWPEAVALPMETSNHSAAPRCLGHLRQALTQPDADRVLDETMIAFEELAERAQRFIASSDYRFRGHLTDEERRSWRDLIAVFGGEAPGVSLHDARIS